MNAQDLRNRASALYGEAVKRTGHYGVPAPVRWGIAADLLAVVAHVGARGMATFTFPLLVTATAGGVWWYRHRKTASDADLVVWALAAAWVLTAAHVGPLAWDLVLQVVLWGAVAALIGGRRLVAGAWERWADQPATLTAETIGVVHDPEAVDGDPAPEVVGEGTPFLAPAIPGEPPSEEVPGPDAPVKMPAPFRTGGTVTTTAADAERVQVILADVLEQFEIDARVAGYDRSPATTRHYIELGPKVRVPAVTGLAENFAYALGLKEIEKPAVVSGRSAIGVVVPNEKRDMVLLGDVLASPAAVALGACPLIAGLGRDTSNADTLIDLRKLPHLLIAGSTGSGKTISVHDILASILARATPQQVRLLLIDPKRVELAMYAGIPHLLTPIITSPKKAAEALGWLVGEMDRRYGLLAEHGFRHIDDFNEAARKGKITGDDGQPLAALEYLLAVIDELADLMMVAPKDVEDLIVRLTQLGRAAGCHLVAATQRPSVDGPITGLIKANMPARLVLAVASMADSRVALDKPGAEKLLGQGDALLLTKDDPSRPVRLQMAYVSEKEIRDLVAAVIKLYKNAAPAEPTDLPAVTSPAAGEDPEGEDLELLIEAARLVIATQHGSVSMLQRKLRVGYPKAGALMDALEKRGIVGEANGSQPRDVLVKADDLEDALASLTTETAGV